MAYIVIFRSYLDPAYEEEYLKTAQKMEALVKKAPGYITHKSFISSDEERITLSEFESEEAILKWKNHPEHLKAQKQGQEKYYKSYTVQICPKEKEYRKITNCK